ncbi:MAG: DUF2779 domain-containing protein [Nitrospiraceae bacterium]|nr:MAG: DUF2779 domain-containing protein [Nitrospiraceae bacterium]
MNSKLSLSKSQFMRGLQCRKSLWLYKYNPELGTPPDAMQQAIFDMGTEVGLYARQLFPGGTAIEFEGSTFAEKVRKTQELVQGGEHTIYEATIAHDDIIVMVDILHKGPKGWELYEVKSSSRLKDEHANDVSIQYYVLKGSGLTVSKAALVHMNNEYVRHGDIAIADLFAVEELTDEVQEREAFIGKELLTIRSMLQGPCPDIDIGAHCTSPYDCDFIDHCWKHIPENSVFDLRGKGIDKFEYYTRDIIRFQDLHLDTLNLKQRMQVEAELNDTETIDQKGIADFLDTLHYPQYFLDFETFMPAIPRFEGTRPYQNIPFQYSLHVLDHDGADLKHHEFLAEAGTDPRERIARDLSALIPDTACVITYNSSFEKGRIKELAEQFPRYAERLMQIHDSIVDLMVPFRQRLYYTREMKGSYSIKYVLPALVPDMSHQGLVISGGGDAMNVYSTLHLIEDVNEVGRIRQDLLSYCRMDTLGMVRILDKLREVSRNSP